MFIKIKVYTHIFNYLKFFQYILKKNFKETSYFKYKIINLPSKSSKFTVLKSPFIFKKARTQFEEKIYSCIIYIFIKKNFNNINYFFLFFKYFLNNVLYFFKNDIKYHIEIGLKEKEKIRI